MKAPNEYTPAESDAFDVTDPATDTNREALINRTSTPRPNAKLTHCSRHQRSGTMTGCAKGSKRCVRSLEIEAPSDREADWYEVGIFAIADVCAEAEVRAPSSGMLSL